MGIFKAEAFIGGKSLRIDEGEGRLEFFGGRGSSPGRDEGNFKHN